MKSTIYNVTSHCWKDVTLIGQDLLTYRLGHTLLPLYNEHRVCDKVLILGGIDIAQPVMGNKDLTIVTLNFKAAQVYAKGLRQTSSAVS